MTTEQNVRTLAQLPKDLLTVREVAQYLRVDDTTVRRWIKANTLLAVELPRKGRRHAYRIRRATLDELLSRQSA